jgi:hypothetical protein
MSSIDTNALLISEIVIGKDILELLSSSMYVEPLTVYREYVQNAADAIDQAVLDGTLADRAEGIIDVQLDHIERRARIRDNGTGISRSKFVRILSSFGSSQKRGSDARGFRGVGRLAGLGYCQELVFRSRVSIEDPVLELRWDCRVLKRHLTDHSYSGGLQEIVKDVTTLNELHDYDAPGRFFEVEIIKPKRIGQDTLLNEEQISSYLSQIAPVPFSNAFSLRSRIGEYFSDAGFPIAEFNIFINGDEEPVVRMYSDEFSLGVEKSNQHCELETFMIHAQDGELAALGWIMHHDYLGAIPAGSGVRGLRARVGNIQIGGDRLFVDIFPEERFSSWTVGEVHVVDPRLTPNGRRDNFDQSSHMANLVNHLSPLASKVARNCRVSSQRRNRLKVVELGLEKIQETCNVITQGGLSKLRQKALKRDVGAKFQEIKSAINSGLLDDGVRSELRAKVLEMETEFSRIDDVGIVDDPLSEFSAQKQNSYREFIDLIYECSQSHVIAKSLVDRILSRLKTSG